MSVCVLAVCTMATRGGGQTSSNKPPTASPTLDEIEAAHVQHYPRSNLRIAMIATNTPAFDEYAFNLMFTEAERVRSSWKLKRVPPLTAHNVTWDAVAMKDGVDGGISTSGRRFGWSFTRNALWCFHDIEYTSQSVMYKDFTYNRDEQRRLGKIKSKITAKQAEDLARGYLHAIGLTEKQLDFIEPPRVNQFKFRDHDGTIYSLPLFAVGWAIKDWVVIENDPLSPVVSFEISGITGEVATYYNSAPKLPLTPLPTNYLDMLEVLPPTTRMQSNGVQMWPHK
jgi:hypothetical protein